MAAARLRPRAWGEPPATARVATPALGVPDKGPSFDRPRLAATTGSAAAAGGLPGGGDATSWSKAASSCVLLVSGNLRGAQLHSVCSASGWSSRQRAELN